MRQLSGYKVLTSELCARLKLHAKALIARYQCGFRPGKSTIDQMLEKRHENQDKIHHIFVEFQAAFDGPVRDRVYTAMSELGIPAKQIRLCRMTLSNSCSFVKVGKDLSVPFDTVRAFRQGEPLSCDLFNFLLESVLRKAGGTIYYKSVH